MTRPSFSASGIYETLDHAIETWFCSTFGVRALFLGVISAGFAADPPKAKVTYQDHVSTVFRSRCGSCHNPDKQKGGLNLDNYGVGNAGRGIGQGHRAGRCR